jgi:hypothetical protein
MPYLLVDKATPYSLARIGYKRSSLKAASVASDVWLWRRKKRLVPRKGPSREVIIILL